MAHASIQTELPELPGFIRDRLVPRRAATIEEGLRALEHWHPGLFDAMRRTIQLLENYPGIEGVNVDYDEDDVLYPATVWAQSTFSPGERLQKVAELEEMTDAILERYPDVVLAAIL